MVQCVSGHTISICSYYCNKEYLMSDLMKDYDRAMRSQNTSFMNVVAGRLLDAGYEIEAEIIINQIFYFTEDVMKKNTDTVSNRFNDIIRCDGGG